MDPSEKSGVFVRSSESSFCHELSRLDDYLLFLYAYFSSFFFFFLFSFFSSFFFFFLFFKVLLVSFPLSR